MNGSGVIVAAGLMLHEQRGCCMLCEGPNAAVMLAMLKDAHPIRSLGYGRATAFLTMLKFGNG